MDGTWRELGCETGDVSDVVADPFAAWGNRTPLYDDEGSLLLVFTLAESTRSGRRWADGAWRPDTASVEASSRTVLEAMAGFAFSTSDTELVDALTAAGATELRHAHVMSHPLNTLPELPVHPALDIRPLNADDVAHHAQRLGEINVRAYPANHPDHEFDTVDAAVREMREIGLGRVLGPFLNHSTVALVDEVVVGVCLLVDREGAPPDGGPWIVEVFRDPDAPVKRVGSALISAALSNCRVANLPGLSLAVSHRNANAYALYGALGFRDDTESWTLALP